MYVHMFLAPFSIQVENKKQERKHQVSNMVV